MSNKTLKPSYYGMGHTLGRFINDTHQTASHWDTLTRRQPVSIGNGAANTVKPLVFLVNRTGLVVICLFPRVSYPARLGLNRHVTQSVRRLGFSLPTPSGSTGRPRSRSCRSIRRRGGERRLSHSILCSSDLLASTGLNATKKRPVGHRVRPIAPSQGESVQFYPHPPGDNHAKSKRRSHRSRAPDARGNRQHRSICRGGVPALRVALPRRERGCESLPAVFQRSRLQAFTSGSNPRRGSRQWARPRVATHSARSTSRGASIASA